MNNKKLERTIVLMGGCPSSGTTMLLVQLANHKQVIGLHETGLFSHPGLYNDFEKFRRNYLGFIKSKLFKYLDEGERFRKGLSPHLLVNNSRIEAHNIDFKTVIEILESSTDVETYLYQMESIIVPLENKIATHVVEKTPANLYAIPNFLTSKLNAKAIVIVRDPIDTVSSLSSRGIPLYRAMAIWLLDTAIASLIRKMPGGLVVSYENLIKKRDTTLKKIYEHIELEIPFDSNLSKFKIIEFPSQWYNSPNSKLVTRSIGRGHTELDELDKAVFSIMKIHDFPSSKLDAVVGMSAQQVAELFGYNISQQPIIKNDRIEVRQQLLARKSLETEPRQGRSTFYDYLVY